MATDKKGGVLYLVATPIGNMGDITARALDVLSRVSLIAAEDTRVTRKLLARHDLHTVMVSFFEHNELARTDEILARLAEGKDVALVTTAGSPTVSDPGFRLVKQALDAGYTAVPVPGPCSPIAALSASGLPTDRFSFEGFLPRKGTGRLNRLKSISDYEGTVILFESPNRLAATLDDLLAALGDAPCAVAREMTKAHEEFIRGSITEVLGLLRETPPRGEVTIVLDARKRAGGISPADPEEAERECRKLIGEGVLKAGVIAAKLSKKFGITRKEAYRIVLRSKEEVEKDRDEEGID